MCLVKVKQEEDHVVPYRVVQQNRHSSHRRASRQSRDIERRYSRTEIVHDSPPRPSASYISVPSPKPLQIPAPQPVPMFVQPPPPAPMPAPPPPPSHISSHHTHAQSHHGGAHYVEVSPRSSMSSRSSSPGRSEYVYREREVRRERERNYSPENPRYEHYRYVEPASSESDQYERYQRQDRSRQRSRSRGGYDDRETNTRVSYSRR
jgi:hypothetical protein